MTAPVAARTVRPRHFLAVDWGTSGFRARAVGAGVTGPASRSAERMRHAVGTGFAAVLARHLAALAVPADWPVLICSMAGARGGRAEVPYLPLPVAVGDLAGGALRLSPEQTGGRDIRILQGLAQSGPADVMRGEETQLPGLALDGHSGTICLPGTHCKWAMLTDGRITGFASSLTGNLFALLAGQGILRHAMPDNLHAAPDVPAFRLALEQALADPAEPLAGQAGLGPLYAAGLESGGRDCARRC